jgi:hypothetical protein
MLATHLVFGAVALGLGAQTCSRRAEATPAGEAPPSAPPLASALAIASGLPAAPPLPGSSAEALAPEPVDLAIAPQGGVPYHPSGTPFRSPFASPQGKALPVKVAVMVNSVDEYSITTGKFTADFYLSLTSTEPMPPRVDLHCTNGTLDQEVVLANRPTFKLYRMQGTFKSPPDLRKYPFDTQELKIILEDDSQGTDQLRLVVDHDRTTLARGFRAVGWRAQYIEARSLSFTYGERFENDDLYYGRYIVRIGLERFAAGSIFKVYIPALVIVLISILGMWVPPDEMEVRSNTGAPMLAAAVLFHYSLMQELPATSYLTRADKLMLGVYIALLLGMISTWLMFLVKQKHVDRVFRVARVAVPLLSVITMAIACLL